MCLLKELSHLDYPAQLWGKRHQRDGRLDLDFGRPTDPPPWWLEKKATDVMPSPTLVQLSDLQVR